MQGDSEQGSKHTDEWDGMEWNEEVTRERLGGFGRILTSQVTVEQ